MPTDIGDLPNKRLDPRYLRTREHIRLTARDMLALGASRDVTFTRVAAAAGINRGTVHQHYATRLELVADALVNDLAPIALAATDCPLADGPRPPEELIRMTRTAGKVRPIVDRLAPEERSLVTDRLAQALTHALTIRFKDGQRPPGFADVPLSMHAQFVAAGLSHVLLRGGPNDAEALWRLVQGSVTPGPQRSDEERRATTD